MEYGDSEQEIMKMGAKKLLKFNHRGLIPEPGPEITPNWGDMRSGFGYDMLSAIPLQGVLRI